MSGGPKKEPCTVWLAEAYHATAKPVSYRSNGLRRRAATNAEGGIRHIAYRNLEFQQESTLDIWAKHIVSGRLGRRFPCRRYASCLGNPLRHERPRL